MPSPRYSVNLTFNAKDYAALLAQAKRAGLTVPQLIRTAIADLQLTDAFRTRPKA